MQCSPTQSDDAKNWPEGIISAKITMNPYVYALAIEEAYKQGISPWEYINLAIWEKIGKPDHDTLLEFAANQELADEDPKWKKRLKIGARYEVEMAAVRKQRAQEAQEDAPPSGDGNGHPK
ncbi:hypothetical protein ACFL2Q_19465 [Thermodesulfobacteriota bacterium]